LKVLRLRKLGVQSVRMLGDTKTEVYSTGTIHFANIATPYPIPEIKK